MVWLEFFVVAGCWDRRGSRAELDDEHGRVIDDSSSAAVVVGPGIFVGSKPTSSWQLAGRRWGLP